MKFIISYIIFSCAYFLNTFAQTNPPESYPEIGWDSLKSLIVYPNIGINTGITDNNIVTVYFDSLSNVVDIKIEGNYIFFASIIDAIKKTKWIPKLYFYEKWLPEPAKFEVVFKFVSPNKVGHRILRIEEENEHYAKDDE